jgi:predicted negative regulator of RcsB-dependent stress response
MGRRITRKQLKQDEFVSAGETIIRWFVDNWRPVVFGLLAVCVLIVAWWTIGRWSSVRAERASYDLYEAMSSVEEAISSGDRAAAREQLDAFIEDHGSSDQADMARVYLARLMMDESDLDGARALLVEVSDRHRTDVVGSLAALDLVRLRVAAGEIDEVTQQLEGVVVGQDPSLPRDVALWELGELFVGQDQADRARVYFQQLVDEFPESPYRGRASQRLTELG